MNDSQLLNGLACAAISLSLNLLFQNNQSVDPEIKNILSILPNLLIRICSTNNLSNSAVRASSSDISSIERSRTSPESSNYNAEDERPESIFIDSKTGIQYREVDPVLVRKETPTKKLFFNDSQNLPRNLINFSPENVSRNSKRNTVQAFSTPIKSSKYNRNSPVQIDQRSFLRRYVQDTSNKSDFNDFSHISKASPVKETVYVDMRPQLARLKRQINFDDAARPGTSRRDSNHENENLE